MINLNINFYLMKTIFILTYFYIYALQNALSLCWETNLSDSNTLCIVATCVPKTGETCYYTDFLPLIIFHSSNKSGETVEHVGNYSPEIGEMQGRCTNHEWKKKYTAIRDTQQRKSPWKYRRFCTFRAMNLPKTIHNHKYNLPGHQHQQANPDSE